MEPRFAREIGVGSLRLFAGLFGARGARSVWGV